MKLAKFTNEEFYYIISSLLSLGDPGFVSEQLYVSFDQNNLGAPEDIKFLFLTSNLIQGDNGEKEVTEYTVGKIDSEFDNIEIYSWHCDPAVMSPKKTGVDVLLIKSMLREYNAPIPYRPASLLKEVNRIVSENKFEERIDNDLFNLKWHVNLPNGIRHQFDFGEIGNLRTDFSGSYFLVVEPDRTDIDRVIVNSFQVSERQEDGVILFDGDSRDEIANISQRFIDNCVPRVLELKKNEGNHLSQGRHESHKARMMTVLAETIVWMINDLPERKRKELLNGESVEDFVKYLQEKYEEEFDLHVDDLGVIGADEIAWTEALGELNGHAHEMATD